MTVTSLRPWFFALVGLCGALLAGRLYAQGRSVPAAEATGSTVRFERADGSKAEGTISLTHLTLKTDFGTSEVATNRIRSIQIRAEEGRIAAVVELDDRTKLHGDLTTKDVGVTVAGRAELLAFDAVRQMTFLKPSNGSLWAVLFGLLTLVVMEIVLGVDNVIFLVIVADKLPADRRPAARKIGLILALGTRLLLLLTLSWLIGLTRPLFTLPRLPFLEAPDARDVSIRDLILLVGGLFLMRQSVKEMHEKVTAARSGKPHGGHAVPAKAVSFLAVVLQIAVVDIVFSLDSVITAIGMVEDLWVMIVAMVVAMFVMLVFSQSIADFVSRNPTIKVLALSFLILIGVLLVAEGLGQHIDKGYVYFAMAFAVGIELINMRLRPKPADADKLA